MNLLQLLERDLASWKKRKDDFEGLEKIMIQTHIDKLETTIKIYKKQKVRK
jgi:hypothetical protein